MAKDPFPDLETALQGTHVYNPRAIERFASNASPCAAIQGNIAVTDYEEVKSVSSLVKGAITRHLDGCGDCTKDYLLLKQLDKAISFYQDNESLSAAQRKAMLVHLNTCDGCGTSYREYIRTTDIARQIFGIPPKRNV